MLHRTSIIPRRLRWHRSVACVHRSGGRKSRTGAPGSARRGPWCRRSRLVACAAVRLGRLGWPSRWWITANRTDHPLARRLCGETPSGRAAQEEGGPHPVARERLDGRPSVGPGPSSKVSATEVPALSGSTSTRGPRTPGPGPPHAACVQWLVRPDGARAARPAGVPRRRGQAGGARRPWATGVSDEARVVAGARPRPPVSATIAAPAAVRAAKTVTAAIERRRRTFAAPPERRRGMADDGPRRPRCRPRPPATARPARFAHIPGPFRPAGLRTVRRSSGWPSGRWAASRSHEQQPRPRSRRGARSGRANPSRHPAFPARLDGRRPRRSDLAGDCSRGPEKRMSA